MIGSYRNLHFFFFSSSDRGQHDAYTYAQGTPALRAICLLDKVLMFALLISGATIAPRSLLLPDPAREVRQRFFFFFFPPPHDPPVVVKSLPPTRDRVQVRMKNRWKRAGSLTIYRVSCWREGFFSGAPPLLFFFSFFSRVIERKQASR